MKRDIYMADMSADFCAFSSTAVLAFLLFWKIIWRIRYDVLRRQVRWVNRTQQRHSYVFDLQW